MVKITGKEKHFFEFLMVGHIKAGRLWHLMAVDIIYNMRREMLRRGMSRKTVKTYLIYVKKFLLFAKEKSPREFSKKDVRAFLYRTQEKGVSGSTLNVAHNALRFMMVDILHKAMYLKIRFSKIPVKKPDFLTEQEIKQVLEAISNKKHWLIVALMYGAGLRVGEAVRLKKSDFDFEGLVGWVRQGKGGKDRPFIIPEVLEKPLKELAGQSDSYIFPGRNRAHLSVKAVQEIVRKAGKSSRLGRHLHPHMFRHSFTTHLLESDEDISTVQALLGHVHPETTFGYSHAAKPRLIKTKSPLDRIMHSDNQKVFKLQLQ